MANLIIINDSTAAELSSLRDKAAQAGIRSVSVLSEQESSDTSPNQALRQSVSRSNSEFSIIARSSLGSSIDLVELTKSLETCFVQTQCPDGQIDNLPQNAEEILSYIASNRRFVIPAFIISKRSLSKATDFGGSTYREAIARLLINLISVGEEISIAKTTATISESQRYEAGLSQKELAELLKVATQLFNIEELFPRESWGNFPEETAALSLHTLAAIFMRLGDSSNAIECLSRGDHLEESPRALALRGLIAEERGEKLEAVAQMVSSLQRYELRKRENDKHAVRFQPKDLEIINSSLYAGLEALNKRDNDQALEHFTKAVFNFDPFYSEIGLGKNRSR